ncbi:ZIP family metal transporter [Amorphoplanes digitatis]
MFAALGWGALASSSLIIGALLAFVHRWPRRLVGAVLAFGSGALISAVSFDLAAEGVEAGGEAAVAVGLAVGALTYFGADSRLERKGRPAGAGPSSAESGSGTALALGACLDGIPEQAVLGIGLAMGGGVSVGLLTAVFVSNLPEAVGSATEMRAAGRSRRDILVLWVAIAGICALSTVGGYAIADVTSGWWRGVINGFAAGALLVMLIDSMIPEAARKSGKAAGLLAVLGFSVAAWLTTVG